MSADKQNVLREGPYAMGRVTRVEVIDHSKPFEQGGGRILVRYDLTDVEIQVQDDGRTLKVFMR